MKKTEEKKLTLLQRIGFAAIFAFLASFAFGILPLQPIQEKPVHSAHTVQTQIESSSADQKDDSSAVIKNMIVNISQDDYATLILAVQHETGINKHTYQTVEERDNYDNLSPSEKEDFEKILQGRFDTAQQLTAAAMLHRIGKRGFSWEKEFPENLIEVLSQEGQFSEVDEYGEITSSLIDDISHYWELPTADQYDPCDARTIENINKVLYGEVDIPSDLVYEIRSVAFASEEDAANDLKSRNSWSDYVYPYMMVPCSYWEVDENGNPLYLADYWCVYGINSTGTGYATPID